MSQGEHRPKKRVEGVMLMAVRQHTDTRLRPHFTNTEDFREAGFTDNDEIAVITLEELDRLVELARAHTYLLPCPTHRGDE